MRNLVLFTSMILSFWGCSSDKDFGDLENIGWNEKPLQITTRILTTKSTNFIQEFKDKVTEFVTVSELATMMNVSPTQLITHNL